MVTVDGASFSLKSPKNFQKKYKIAALQKPTTISWFLSPRVVSIFKISQTGHESQWHEHIFRVASGESCKKKWKNLRDNYTRLKASAKDLQRSGSAATYNGKWIPMDAMDAFMQFHIKHKALVSFHCCCLSFTVAHHSSILICSWHLCCNFIDIIAFYRASSNLSETCTLEEFHQHAKEPLPLKDGEGILLLSLTRL